MFGRSADRVPAIPDGVPVLSRGRHRNPRKGACFMEMASFLAGERWSDHPRCTHPLLASLARCVNDALGDDSRQQLPMMIPEVVGLRPEDPRVVPELVRVCALAALPVVAAERQNVMALALLTTERTLAMLDGRDLDSMSPESRAALAYAPQAESWARAFIMQSGLRPKPMRADAASSIVALAVGGIHRACVDDPEPRLIALLRTGIDMTKRYATATPVAPAVPSAPAPAPAQESGEGPRPARATRG